MIVVLDNPYHDNSKVLGVFADWETCLDYFEKINPNPNKETWVWLDDSPNQFKFDYFPRDYIIDAKPGNCNISFWENVELGFELYHHEENNIDVLDKYFEEKLKESDPEAYKFRLDGPKYNENIL
jgi:hypothetical protein